MDDVIGPRFRKERVVEHMAEGPVCLILPSPRKRQDHFRMTWPLGQFLNLVAM